MADQVDKILDEIKNLSAAKLSSEVFESKMSELKEATVQKNEEMDRHMGDMETQLETKLASMVDNIGSAFAKSNYNAPSPQNRFKDFGEFLGKVKSGDMKLKDLAESAGDTGGYLVPEQFSNEILSVQLESAVIRNAGARVIPIARNIIHVPAKSIYNNASGSLYGGVTAYWGKENAVITESQPSFDRITLEVKKLTGYVEDSNELDADAITSMGSLLAGMFSEVLNFEEDYAFINGNGVNKPLGVLSSPCLVTVSRTTASQIGTVDVINMISRFRGSLDRAVILVSQTSLPSIYKMSDGAGNYIWHPGTSGNVTGKALGTIYGIPFVVTEKCPALGTTGDILLGDFGHYLIGERQEINVAYSEHFKFQSDQMAYRVTKRVDGQPWLKSAITPRLGGLTLSPFVALS